MLTLARSMGMTAVELGGRMDAREFAEHLALADLDPWGEDRADLRSAMLARTMLACHGVRAELSELMPRFDRPDDEEQPTLKTKLADTFGKVNAMAKNRR